MPVFPQDAVGDWPAGNAAAITPDDDNDLDTPTRAIYIGTSGDVKVDLVDSGTVTFANVPIGILPVQAKRVYDTGTGASNLVALW